MSHSTRVDVLNGPSGRVLCVADLRGNLSLLNALAKKHHAVAVLHTGDFGFLLPASLDTVSERTLRHLVTYSPLISPSFRTQLLAAPFPQLKALLREPPRSAQIDGGQDRDFFALSQFPKLLSGQLKLNVPVYTVYGACEDVQVIEKLRLAAPSAFVPFGTSAPPVLVPSYSIPNLTVLDEATTRMLVLGGLKLRLFGLGGAVVNHRLFDNGSGNATIAGGGGTMWTTMLQIGELVDTAQKVYDPTETRLLLSHASPGKEGLLAQLALVLKVDLTLSAGLHFRYGTSYNEFSVQADQESFSRKLELSRKAFLEVWDSVKGQVEGSIDANQRLLLDNALMVVHRVPSSTSPGSAQLVEEISWKNTWNWNLPDATFGTLVMEIQDGRIATEMTSQGFNFAYRQAPPPPTVPVSAPELSGIPAVVHPAPPPPISVPAFGSGRSTPIPSPATVPVVPAPVVPAPAANAVAPAPAPAGGAVGQGQRSSSYSNNQGQGRFNNVNGASGTSNPHSHLPFHPSNLAQNQQNGAIPRPASGPPSQPQGPMQGQGQSQGGNGNGPNGGGRFRGRGDIAASWVNPPSPTSGAPVAPGATPSPGAEGPSSGPAPGGNRREQREPRGNGGRGPRGGENAPSSLPPAAAGDETSKPDGEAAGGAATPEGLRAGRGGPRSARGAGRGARGGARGELRGGGGGVRGRGGRAGAPAVGGESGGAKQDGVATPVASAPSPAPTTSAAPPLPAPSAPSPAPAAAAPSGTA